MKEAFWGVLIVMLGLLGIVIINVFQKITTTNDETYYLMKEVTEAAAYDAIDLTYYRLNGDLRIVEDKFVENFTRRFAQSLSNRGNYTITIQDILEQPPKLSLSIRTGITSLQGEAFGIVNRTDGIIETKYKIEDITGFLGITTDEWLNRININTNKEENACKITTTGSEEYECMPGDIEFGGWEDLKLQEAACDTDLDKLKEKTITATYKTCDCGKWTSKEEEVSATPKRVGNYFTYIWNLKVDGEIRSIDETNTGRIVIDICTTDIEIWVPKELKKSEPGSDNSAYNKCPSGGITILQGQIVTLHGNYIPKNASNRELDWETSNKNIVSLVKPSLRPSSTGFSSAAITGKEVGTSTITIKQGDLTSTCKVEVVDTLSCTNKEVQTGVSGQKMINNYNGIDNNQTFSWESSDTSVATINSATGEIKPVKAGSTTITVTRNDNKIGTCILTIKNRPSGSTEHTTTTIAGNCSCRLKVDGEKEIQVSVYGPHEICGTTAKTCTNKSCCGETVNRCANSCCGVKAKSCTKSCCGTKNSTCTNKSCCGTTNGPCKKRILGICFSYYKVAATCTKSCCGTENKTCTKGSCCGYENKSCTNADCCGTTAKTCTKSCCGTENIKCYHLEWRKEKTEKTFDGHVVTSTTVTTTYKGNTTKVCTVVRKWCNTSRGTCNNAVVSKECHFD